MMRHTSTYRLQLTAAFTLADAARTVPYLKRLGADAVYLSPVTTAVPGSRHGYDVCDPGALNPDLGGWTGLQEFADALEDAGIACIVDIVPNHMAADPEHNPWWRDVLKYGPASVYADFFDTDWRPRKEGLHGKILLPVLGGPYGRVLEQGDLKLEVREGELVLRYHETTFPLHPESLPQTFPELQNRDPGDIAVILNGTPGDPASYDRLHMLLEQQSYRLASWKTTRHEANYRRFFDVSSLLGVRMERPGVFTKTHALVGALAARGVIQGVRVDHVDGLKDPHAYLSALRNLLEEHSRHEASYILVEKILEGDETLPEDWNTDGTTGYDFMGELELLFTAPDGLSAVRRIYGTFVPSTSCTPPASTPADLVHACKRHVSDFLFGSELNALADLLDRLSEFHRHFRDFTRDDLRLAVRETIACLPVYRTYGREGFLSPHDDKLFRQTLQEARRRNPGLAPEIFDFLERVFKAFEPAFDPSPLPRSGCRAFSQRLQQIMGAVHAKGVEDTAFYRDIALLSLNEVGLSPGRHPLSVRDFHQRMQARLTRFPQAMIATSTHDTKRGEDVRARISMLAEYPEAWERALSDLRNTGSPGWHHEDYLLYQTLIGCWPMDPDGWRPVPMSDPFFQRLRDAVLKSAREAKIRTSWLQPDEDYESALSDRLEFLLRGAGFPSVQTHLFPLLQRCAEKGMHASLARAACKFAVPGIPDLYQGTEDWDLSLVDPDNRRPVDFARAESRFHRLAPLLESLEEDSPHTSASPAPAPDRRREVAALLQRWPDGDIKRYVTACCLRWRMKHARLFLEGSYTPLPCIPPRDPPAPDVPSGFPPDALAFMRQLGSQALVVFVPLRFSRNTTGREALLQLPRAWANTSWRQLFTGTRFRPEPAGDAAVLPVSALLEDFPVAWLWLEQAAPSDGPARGAPADRHALEV